MKTRSMAVCLLTGQSIAFLLLHIPSKSVVDQSPEINQISDPVVKEALYMISKDLNHQYPNFPSP